MGLSRLMKVVFGVVSGAAIIAGVGEPSAWADGVPMRAGLGSMAAAGNGYPVHIAVKSVQVFDDADKGVWGCGDFTDVQLNVAGEPVIGVDNGAGGYADGGIFGFGTATQYYCSDTNYQLPSGSEEGADHNVFKTFAYLGDSLELSGFANELDNFGNHTVGSGPKVQVPVPAPGQYVDRAIQIEGSNQNGHLRMTLNVRVRTFPA